MEKLDKEVSYFTPNEVSKTFSFLPGVQKVQTDFDYGDYDLFFFLDFTEEKRIKAFSQKHEDYFEDQRIIVIDHHIGTNHNAILELKDESAMSTCELIREVIQVLWPDFIDKTIATQLYLGLTTDSGNFLFDANHERTLRNALSLVQAGADKKTIIDKVLRSKSFAAVQFMQKVLARMQRDGDILWASYTNAERMAAEVDKEEAEYALHTMQNIDGAKLILYIIEKDEELKLSFRSKGQVNCQQLAAIFGGGGHVNAAGASIPYHTPCIYNDKSYDIGPGDYDLVLKIIKAELS